MKILCQLWVGQLLCCCAWSDMPSAAVVCVTPVHVPPRFACQSGTDRPASVIAFLGGWQSLLSSKVACVPLSFLLLYLLSVKSALCLCLFIADLLL